MYLSVYERQRVNVICMFSVQ